MTRNVVIIAFLPEINSHYFCGYTRPLIISQYPHPQPFLPRVNSVLIMRFERGWRRGFTAFRLWPFLGAIKLYLQLSLRRDDERTLLKILIEDRFPAPGSSSMPHDTCRSHRPSTVASWGSTVLQFQSHSPCMTDPTTQAR